MTIASGVRVKTSIGLHSNWSAATRSEHRHNAFVGVGFEASDVLWLTGPLRDWFRERVETAIGRFGGLVDASAARELLRHVTADDPERARGVATLFPWVSAEASVRALG